MTSRSFALIGALMFAMGSPLAFTRNRPKGPQIRAGNFERLGGARSARQLERRDVDAAAATGQVCQQAGAHAGRSEESSSRNSLHARAARIGRFAGRKKMSRARTTKYSCNEARNCLTAARR